VSGLANLISGLNSSPLATAVGDAELIPKSILPANAALLNTVLGLAIGARGLTVSTAAAGEAPALAAGLGTTTPALTPAGLAGTGSAAAESVAPVSVGNAGSVGDLAVPPSWATATPAIRTAAAVLSDTAENAVPAAALSHGSLVTETTPAAMAPAAMVGSALGGAAARVAAGATGRSGGPGKDRKNLKDSETPQELQRLVADMTDQPDNVQHWNTDPENLDALLEQLRQKPGTHAVHVKGARPKVTPPQSRPI
jgi:hypothetical protein